MAEVVFALMHEFVQVFVKVGGLFGHRGRLKLPKPVAGALKGPVLFLFTEYRGARASRFRFWTF